MDAPPGRENARSDAAWAFGQKIRAWREALGLSQGEVDQAIGKRSRGFTAQIETGRLKPPSEDVCRALDVALRRRPGEVWEAAAPERLRDFDPQLYAWHVAEVDRARGAPLTEKEERAVAAFRRLVDEHPGLVSVPALLARVIDGVLAPSGGLLTATVETADGHTHLSRGPAVAPHEAFFGTIVALPSLDPAVQHLLWNEFLERTANVLALQDHVRQRK